MAKKNSVMSYLYLIGMALVVVGFCCPMFTGKIGSSGNGFKFINFSKGGFVSIGALLIFIGGVAGVLACFATIKSPISVKVIALAVSILGGIILVIGFNDNILYKAIGKNMIKNMGVGLILIIVGWIAAIVGKITEQ